MLLSRIAVPFFFHIYIMLLHLVKQMLKGCLSKSMAENMLASETSILTRKKLNFQSSHSGPVVPLLHFMFVLGGFYAAAAPTFTVSLSLQHLITFHFLFQIKNPITPISSLSFS